MECNKCKKSLGECQCPDIDERMEDLKNNPNFIYKMCAVCGLHYERCKCEEPIWVTSHDGVSLEEAVVQPTLEDKMREATEKPGAKAANLFHKAMTEGLPDDAPEELKEALRLLKKVGIEVHVFKGDPRDIQRNIQNDTNGNDLLQFDHYQKPKKWRKAKLINLFMYLKEIL